MGGAGVEGGGGGGGGGGGEEEEGRGLRLVSGRRPGALVGTYAAAVTVAVAAVVCVAQESRCATEMTAFRTEKQ